MSMRYQAAILTASYFPLKAPSAPTIGTATQASSTSVSVTFTAPTDIGGGAISSYTVVSSPGNIIGTGASSPVVVTGLTTGTAYSFTVFANNAYGNSPASASSNVVTPLAIGQQAYTTAGTYSWTAPAGVTSVCVVCVGGGGGGWNGQNNNSRGGGAGGLGWKNNITVVPGNSYTVVVGVGEQGGGIGGTSYFINTSTVAGIGGQGDATGNPSRTSGGGYVGDGGGNGGNGGQSLSYGGGGGAGGYSGNGGAGGTTGASGSGGGGGGANDATVNAVNGYGGGVGILGQGSNGAGGANGGGGSGGAPGDGNGGGTYGGGSYGASGRGGVGAVRIIWGAGRAFPSTNTGDL